MSANDDVDAFCDTLGRWLKAEVDPIAIDRAGALPRRHVAALADMGVFGATLPERYGGAGLSLHGGCRVTDTLARVDRAVATTVGLHLGLGTRGLVAFGTEAQRATWLPRLATGAAIVAFAATEPRAGSDLSRFATRTRITPEGRMSVSGQKIFVTNGGLASVFTVATSLDDARNAAPGKGALAILGSDDAGVSVGAEERKLGLRGSSTTTMHFDEVPITADRLLGANLGEGHAQLAHILAWGRTLMAAGCCGTAARAIDLANDHVHLRHQFGKALIAQPVVRAQLATMSAMLFAMRAIVTHAALASDDPDALERSSLVAKVFASETNWSICDTALQLHGGSGFIEDTGVALTLRDARVTRIFEGANDVLLTRIGTLALVHTSADNGAPPAHELDALVSSTIARIGGGRRLAGLRDPAALHHLGRLVVLRDVARACALTLPAGYGADLAAALSARAIAAIAQAARTLPQPSTDPTGDDAILSSLQSGAHP